MAEDRGTERLQEGQGASETSQSYRVAVVASEDLSQRGQSGSQTSHNYLQAQQAVGNTQEGGGGGKPAGKGK